MKLLFMFFTVIGVCCYGNDGKLSDAIVSIEKVAINMVGNKGKMKLSMVNKFINLTTDAMKIDNGTIKIGGDNRDVAVKGVGDGLTSIVKGIEIGSTVDIIIGGLNVIKSITHMLEPKFVMLTQVLGVISAVFSLFGGSTGGEESTEDMVKRVVDKALTDYKAESLQAEVSGVKRLFVSLSNSIKAFRNEKDITKQQSREFYTKAFEGLTFFGQLEHYIKKWCNVRSLKIDEDKENWKKEAREKSTRCLLICNLYADLSILRQILLTELSSLLSELKKEQESLNVLYLISEEQKADRSIFQFLANPINYKESRYVVAKYYSRIGDYPTLSAYINVLDSKMKSEQNINYMRPSVMICDETKLQGNCFNYEKPQEIDSLKTWTSKVKSAYISAGLSLMAYEWSIFRGKEYGHYYGPGVFSNIARDGSALTSMKINETTKNRRNMILVCDNENLEDGSCTLIPAEEPEPKEISEVIENDGNYWKEKIASLTIPAGVKVVGYKAGGHSFGPFYGPETINKLCEPKTWVKIKVYPKETSSSTEMIKVCSEVNFGGYCCQIEPPKEIGVDHATKHDDLKKICGCSPFYSTNKFQSMKIPGGLKVEIFDEEKFGGQAFGPYTGPNKIARIDGGTNPDIDIVGHPYSDAIIKSMKITKIL